MSSLAQDDLAHIWQYARGCLHELDSARIMITGGTGFFGSWLLESLLFAKQTFHLHTDIVVLSRQPDHFLKNRADGFQSIQWITGDITDFAFPKGNFTHLIHAATPASAVLNESQPLLMFDTIIQGTRHTLDFAVQANVQKCLITSSGAIYGEQPATVSHIDETYPGWIDPLQVSSAYAAGKWSSECLATLYAQRHGLSIKTARCFAFVGPYLPLRSHFAIGNFIANVLDKEPITLKGDGTPYRSYLYAADLMIWLWRILCDGRPGQAYNVGSEHAIALGDLAKTIANVASPTLPVVISKKPDSTIPARRYVPSTQRAQKELGLQQWLSLDESIRRTLEWNVHHDKIK